MKNTDKHGQKKRGEMVYGKNKRRRKSFDRIYKIRRGIRFWR